MKLTLMTSHHVIKAIITVIVSVFIFVQIASAAHSHSHDHADEEHSPCAVCITAAHSDADFDIPPPKPTEPTIFSVPNSIEIAIAQPLPLVTRNDNKAPPPPDNRPSTPRAPPR